MFWTFLRKCGNGRKVSPFRRHASAFFLTRAITSRKGAMRTITKQYIDGAFVDSHGREVMDIINPASGQVIAQATMADEEDARHAIAAATRAFVAFSRATKEERL